ncbi:MAG: hypothetical protein RMI89_09990 [Gloeomargarita sp. SKYBB_i_bin120]|nr:hypothetical protein [Gloeomargarita sp. SKYB120]MDW8178846.1 hypothetical protein [Gloeomargarita sp. SKYBB_i_bin120]
MPCDGAVIELHPSVGRNRLILHINGVTSTPDKQQRDIQALQRMAPDAHVRGVHNASSDWQSDVLESILGRSELWQYQQPTPAAEQRLANYSRLLQHLLNQPDLPPDADLRDYLPQAATGAGLLDGELLRQLPFINQLTWPDWLKYFYGDYPAGASCATLRLAYELAQGIHAGVPILVAAHSQGLIITALATYILTHFFGDYTRWQEQIFILGYGPVILLEELPPGLRGQTILIQDRHDLVAEAFSNMRYTDFWNVLQTQVWRTIQRLHQLPQLARPDSHHSAGYYLGLLDTPASRRAGELMQYFVSQEWHCSPVIQRFRGIRFILEDLVPAGALALRN